MERKTFVSRYLPHIVAIAVFMLICLAYFKPQFEGMELRQSDMVHFSGMNRDIREHKELYGEHPQWAGRLFSGMPSYLIDFNLSGRVVKEAADVLYFLGTPAAYIFLAMSCFYLMLLCFGVNPWLGIIGGIAYGLSAYFPVIIGEGHITKMIALIYAPPMVGGIYLAYRKKLWLGAALAGLFASLEIAANHPQITYYFLFAIIALVVNEFVRSYKEKALKRFWKVTGVLAVTAMLAVGSNAMQLWYVYDFSKDTIRGKSELTQPDGKRSEGLDIEYATAWSYGKAETFNLFIPDLMGRTSRGGFSDDGPVAQSLAKYGAREIATQLPAYWGPQPMTLGPVYIGAVIVFLFVLAMFLLCGANKWWIFVTTVLGILLAWGHNLMWFTEIFMNYVPMYNKFRTVSMVLVLAEWALPLLAVLALQKLWDREVTGAQFKKAFTYSAAIVGGTALIFMVFGSSLFGFSGSYDMRMGLPADVLDAMREERLSMLRTDSLRSLIFVLLTASAVWAFFNGKIKRGIFAGAVVVLVLVDLWGVDRRFLDYDDFMEPAKAQGFQMTAVDAAILQDKEPGFRVANLTNGYDGQFSDASTTYFHRSVGGYNPAKLRRYQDVIERHLARGNWAVYDMLNTKYVISKDEDGATVPQVNPGALGGAWFVDDVKIVDNPDREIAALDDFDPASTAVVDKRFADMVPRTVLPADSSAVIALTDYKVNHLTYRYYSPREAVAVFSEVYYPKGWTAYIDGKEAPYFRADYILRAMQLPAGEHTVEFRFAAPDYAVLAGISYASSFILLGALLAIIVMQVKGNRKNKENGTE